MSIRTEAVVLEERGGRWLDLKKYERVRGEREAIRVSVLLLNPPAYISTKKA